MDTEHIHPQLAADCHHLGSLQASELLIHRNAALPWFILVPETRLNDILDLPDEHRHAVLDECAAVSAFIKQVLGFEKVNFAGLGNVVPQMHLHIVGRRESDPCWPAPVWGNLAEGQLYDVEKLRQWQQGLEKMMGLVPAPL
jgi:diadenosine tetraphosphate (Ap4A) HIT family hydrolase